MFSSIAPANAALINPQYISVKHALISLTRSAGNALGHESIPINCICPGFIVINLCPPPVLNIFAKEHITPIETSLKAYDEFIAGDDLTGQTVELSLGQLCNCRQAAYATDSHRWVMEGAGKIWAQAYAPELFSS
jgi:15-hydroxyprostaglandin dehydrogenase (NAD)